MNIKYIIALVFALVGLVVADSPTPGDVVVSSGKVDPDSYNSMVCQGKLRCNHCCKKHGLIRNKTLKEECLCKPKEH